MFRAVVPGFRGGLRCGQALVLLLVFGCAERQVAPVEAVAAPVRMAAIWSDDETLVASDAHASDEFGTSVALSGDTAVVGAPRDDTGRGSAYVYVRDGDTWSEQQKLTASDAAANDELGTSVAISGDTILLGARGKANLHGAAYVFVREGDSWTEQKELTPSEAGTGFYGTSVALSGDTALVGAYEHSPDEPHAGAAYIYVRAGTTWTEQRKLGGAAGGYNLSFGTSVALSGDTALVGAYEDGKGAAHVFVRTGTTWSEQQKLTSSDADVSELGWAAALSGHTALLGAKRSDSYNGAGYVFVRSGTSWSEQQKLTGSEAAYGDFLGTSVALDGDIALLGGPQAAPLAGTAYVFVRSGSSWSEQETLAVGESDSGDRFGHGVAISGGTGLVGAPVAGLTKGSAYVFRLTADDGDGCEDDLDCLSFHCVQGICCNKVCDYACATGSCLVPQAEACTPDDECESGACADGVCCDTACEGQCEACAEKGSVGTCQAVTGNARGDREACSEAGDPACAARCDGENRDECSFIPANTACDSLCSDSTEIVSNCDGQGRCRAAGPRKCAPYVCGSDACLDSCQSDDECAEAYDCVDAICRPHDASLTCSKDGLSSVLDSGDEVACSPYLCNVMTGECNTECRASDDCAVGVCNPVTRLCEPSGSESDDEAGCGCRVTSGPEPRAMPPWLALAALALLSRRRAPRRVSRSSQVCE